MNNSTIIEGGARSVMFQQGEEQVVEVEERQRRPQSSGDPWNPSNIIKIIKNDIGKQRSSSERL